MYNIRLRSNVFRTKPVVEPVRPPVPNPTDSIGWIVDSTTQFFFKISEKIENKSKNF